MPFYIQDLSLLHRWHFTEAINVQGAFHDEERKSTKLWQRSPLTRARERLGGKGNKLCCDTPGKRTKQKKKIDQCLITNCLGCTFCEDAWYLISGKYRGKKEQALKHCKYFWCSEMLPTHYPVFLLLDFWLFTVSRKHPLIYLLVAFMFLRTPMLPSFTTPVFSENAFPTHFKLLEEAEL